MTILSKELLLNNGWRFLSNKRSGGIQYFIKDYKNKYEDYLEGFLILTTPINENFNDRSTINIQRYSLGSPFIYSIYIGKCPTIEEFIHISELLQI